MIYLRKRRPASGSTFTYTPSGSDGTTPPEFTQQWGSIPLEISDGGTRLAYGDTATDFPRCAASYDPAGTPAGAVSVAARITLDTSQTGSVLETCGVVVCGSGAQGARSGYWATIQVGNVRLWRGAGDGTDTDVDTQAHGVATGVVTMNIEMNHDGTDTLTVYCWENGAAKPGSPQITYTDPSPIVGGFVGIESQAGSLAAAQKYHILTIGDGVPAPSIE